LKAVTMGMVTAITLFWSNKPNPAINHADQKRLIKHANKQPPALDQKKMRRWGWG
jgi:hypothetical protein